MILAFIPNPLGFSGFTGLFQCLSEFFPELERFIGFEIPIVLNLLVQQIGFQFMGVGFAALAQAQLLVLLYMLEEQLAFFLAVTLEGDKRIEFILVYCLSIFARQSMPDTHKTFG